MEGLFYGVLALALTASLVHSWLWPSLSAEARWTHKLRAARWVRIADLREGAPVRLIGAARGTGTLIAPLTGRRCLAYRIVVEEKHKAWHRLVAETRALPFTVDDGTGRALVDPREGQFLLEMDVESLSRVLDDATPVEAEFLARHGMSATGWFFNKTLRYTEGVLEPGERVAVMGRGVREPDPDAAHQVTGYRDALPTRVCLGGSPDQPVIVTDKPELTRG